MEEIIKENIVSEHIQDSFNVFFKVDFGESRVVSVGQEVENSVKDGEEFVLEDVARKCLEFREDLSEGFLVVVEVEKSGKQGAGGNEVVSRRVNEQIDEVFLSTGVFLPESF